MRIDAVGAPADAVHFFARQRSVGGSRAADNFRRVPFIFAIDVDIGLAVGALELFVEVRFFQSIDLKFSNLNLENFDPWKK